ncbi:MAG: hypothetical protein ACI9EW_002550 [Cellvibrionaceae bacterium]
MIVTTTVTFMEKMDNQNTVYLYDDEIDLKAYVKIILAHWMWIVFAPFIAGIIFFAYTSTGEAQYASTALISVSAPILEVEFDTRIRTQESAIDLQNNDLPLLAVSDEIMLNLFNKVQTELSDDIQNHIGLRSHLEASTEIRSGIIKLTGSFNDPELSALVVSEWSTLFVETANLFFQGSQEGSQNFLREQLENAQSERNLINAELIKFQSKDIISRIQTQLASDRKLQQTYINKRSDLEVLLYDIQGLKKLVEQNPNDANILNALTMYMLQNRAFGDTQVGNVQFEVPNFEDLSASDTQSHVALLTSLESIIAIQQADIETRLIDLEPLILHQQQQLEVLNIERQELDNRRTIILNTHEILARKVAESELEQSDTSGKAQIVSRSITPVEAEPRNRLIGTVIAAVIAGMLVTGAVLIYAWWVEEDEENKSEGINMSPTAVGFTNGNGQVAQPIGSSETRPTEK